MLRSSHSMPGFTEDARQRVRVRGRSGTMDYPDMKISRKGVRKRRCGDKGRRAGVSSLFARPLCTSLDAVLSHLHLKPPSDTPLFLLPTTTPLSRLLWCPHLLSSIISVHSSSIRSRLRR